MYSTIIIRQWPRLVTLCRSSSSAESQKLSVPIPSGDDISPPPRIVRGPTDILQALAATVGPDPTAAHYKYHDDPYLIPLSNYRKRAYALSAEAGRKAAAWIRDEHADLFTTRVWDPPLRIKTPYFNADPRIDAFGPKPIYNDDSKVTEADLKYTIQNSLIDDSIKVFQLLGGVDGVSPELKTKFLQLLCFYNEKESDSAEWLEERWFAASTKERQATTWRLGGLADQIFTSMEPKTPESYCAIIQGMAKYYQAERAHTLAQEAREKGIPLSTSVYNSLIGCVGFLREGTTLRTEALKSLLQEMREQNLTPNQETLTACLKSISVWGSGKILHQLAIQIVAEFKALGINPGLAAYYYLLCLFCKERGPRVDILSTIVHDLEKRGSLEPKEATDTNFFITAMGVCSDHLQDINLAERLHALLMKDDNYKLVGDAYKESIYYRHLVTVACRHASFERLTHLLDTLVPNVYVPEPTVMEEIIKTLELAGSGERLAQCWSQLVVFGHAKRARLVERLLVAYCNVYPAQDEEIKSKIRNAAADIYKFGTILEEQGYEKDLRSPVQMQLSAKALTNIISLCADCGDKTSESWAAVEGAAQKLHSGSAAGVPSDVKVLVDAANNAATVGKQGLAAMVISYLAENGFEEAASGGVQALSAMLNRPSEEVEQLLQQPRGLLAAALQPAALAIAEAYHLAKSGAPVKPVESSSTSSSSDSGSDSDDD